jgi:hypothetical protein
MATKPGGGSGWLAGDTPATEVVLQSARRVLGERGFSGARVDAAMRRALAEAGLPLDAIFLLLWERHHAAHADTVRAAVAQARLAGVADPALLFETGARAYLQGSWHRRDLALLFCSADGPADYAALRRHLRRRWLRRNAALLGLDDSPGDRLHAAVVTALVGRGAREVAAAGDFRQARDVIDAVAGYAQRLAAGRPGD